MVRIEVPAIRKGGAAGWFRAAWTMPTTLIGHAAARISGCGTPERIGGPATHAWLYLLPERRFQGFGAIAIGHAIIVERAFLEQYGPWLLAHELAHTRQHDWLGPAYLPLHALLQLISALIYALRPRAGFSPWHTYNPLERVFICVPVDAVASPPPPGNAQAASVLRAFGLTE
jgi:GNAT superfamily N-acetyltransferase